MGACDSCFEEILAGAGKDYCDICETARVLLVYPDGHWQAYGAVVPQGNVQDIALEAVRLMGVTAAVCSTVPSFECQASELYWEAEQAAFLAGYLHPGEQLPVVFAEVEQLAKAFEFAQGKRRRDDAATRRAVENARMVELRKAALDVLAAERARKLAAAGAGAVPELPTPVEVVQRLLMGESVVARGYTLTYDAGITWCTDTNGVDGVLGAEPDIEMMRGFLADMARGVDYGQATYAL